MVLIVVHFCCFSIKLGGIEGDGYKGNDGQKPSSPHTINEMFEGLTVHRAAEVGGSTSWFISTVMGTNFTNLQTVKWQWTYGSTLSSWCNRFHISVACYIILCIAPWP